MQNEKDLLNSYKNFISVINPPTMEWPFTRTHTYTENLKERYPKNYTFGRLQPRRKRHHSKLKYPLLAEDLFFSTQIDPFFFSSYSIFLIVKQQRVLLMVITSIQYNYIPSLILSLVSTDLFL